MIGCKYISQSQIEKIKFKVAKSLSQAINMYVSHVWKCDFIVESQDIPVTLQTILSLR